METVHSNAREKLVLLLGLSSSGPLWQDLLWICDLQNALSQVFPFKHTQESRDCIVHTICDMIDALETTFSYPFAYVFIPRFGMRHYICIEYQEALPLDPFSDNLGVILDALVLSRLVVVGGDATTRN